MADILEKEVLVRSKQRVSDHGEVYTPAREVNAMLDLVRHETERIDSRFLEPACGNGNFLAEVLERKLTIVNQRYFSSQFDYERYAILAVSSLYGIDILQDNVQECRQRLATIFENHYSRLFGPKVQEASLASVRFILSLNIVHGDALTFQTVSTPPTPIVFAEWSAVNGCLIKRRDFAFRELVTQGDIESLPLFSESGENVIIPTPIREYPLVHFLKIADAF